MANNHDGIFWIEIDDFGGGWQIIVSDTKIVAQNGTAPPCSRDATDAIAFQFKRYGYPIPWFVVELSSWHGGFACRICPRLRSALLRSSTDPTTPR